MKKYVCPVCGYVYEGDELPEGFKCPICGVSGEKFQVVEGDLKLAAEHAPPMREAAKAAPIRCSVPFPAPCFLMCHCEERSDVPISQDPDGQQGTPGEIAAACTRLPRAQSALAMTNREPSPF